MKILITTGPTREYIDDVRFITNASSGKMGVELAKASLARNHEVTLIHGPISVELPDCNTIAVTSAEDMFNAVKGELQNDYDVFISAAAVADFKPDKVRGKIKSGRETILNLKPTEKITAYAKKNFPKLKVVAFKAEYGPGDDQLLKKAMTKKGKEGLDAIIANNIRDNPMGGVENEVFIIEKGVKHIQKAPKGTIASEIISTLGF